jgi:competence protein ComEC
VDRASLVLLAAALVGGILSGLHGVAFWTLSAGVGLALVVRGVRPDLRAGVAAALAAGALLGRPHADVPLDGRVHTVVVHGTVAGDVSVESFGATFALRADDGTMLETATSGPAPAVGDRVQVRGRLEHFDEPRNPGEPSARALADERGLAARLVRARVLSRNAPDDADWRSWIPRIRAWAGARLHERLDEPAATILAGAMWGERGALPPDLRAEFQDTGTMHVLVTAGLHLGVVAALAAWLLGAAGCGRVPSALLGIAVVWAYAAFSGAHLPSVRAATMISFGLLARAGGRDPFSWNALGAAAIVIGVFWTRSVDSLSFALSFSCVAAIMLFAKPIARALEHVGVRGFAGEAVALTLATQLGTWPLTAAAFLVFAPYAPIANALVVPVVGLAMLAGFAQLAATPLAGLAQAVANVDGSLLLWIVGVVRFVGGLPGAHIVTTPAPVWAIAVYDGAMIGVAALMARRRFALACAAFGAAVAIVAWPPRSVSHDLAVTAIDVGQADALLVRTPSGHAYLVDAGGRLERGPNAAGGSPAEAVGERVVVPFLVRAGIHHLDAILLSHPHGDHAGGLAPVLRTLGADEFADSGQTYPGHAYQDALAVARDGHVPMLYPRGGDVWRTGDGVTFRFYGPTLPLLTNTRNDINNNSLVFRLEYGQFRMLFTGDAGSEAEARILASGADLHADVLKVGHHGSAYSSTPEFIRAVSPSVAVISVGRDNLFGHPARSTIETLEGAGARVYRTDEEGAVTLRSDGRRLDVSTMFPPAQRASVNAAAHTAASVALLMRAVLYSRQKPPVGFRSVRFASACAPSRTRASLPGDVPRLPRHLPGFEGGLR